MMAEKPNATPKWLVMVYMAADSTLTNFAVESLKQLRDAASDSCVVAAQFDAPGRNIARYIFDGTNKGESLNSRKTIKDDPDPDAVTDDPHTLAYFINWAERKYPDAKYRGLLLWGHGPELLFESPTNRQNGSTKRLYFTPVQLASALSLAGQPVHIIGFDACSMAMVEYANELRALNAHAPYVMIASQREVPDLSFPYSEVLKNLKLPELDLNEVCAKIINWYVQTYEDYVCGASTGAEPVTLSALSVHKVKVITDGIRDLAKQLTSPALEDTALNAIYEARTGAQGFVGGLFVDICDFCDRLCEASREIPQDLKDAAAHLSEAIRDDNPHTGCVLVNKGIQSSLCHGLSIYFPYLKDGSETEKIEQPLAKGAGGDLDGKGAGGDLDGKGAGGDLDGKTLLNAAVASVRYAVRRDIIKDTETYYKDPAFRFAHETEWRKFIGGVWSPILANREHDSLDVRYSAQQCVLNLIEFSPKHNASGSQEKSATVVYSRPLGITPSGRAVPDLTIETGGKPQTMVIVAVNSNGSTR